jgi:hypothetical protein
LEYEKEMPDPIGYDIDSYGIFLQRKKKDFGKLLEKAVLVTAIVTCHPSNSEDFDKVYIVFTDSTSIPEFDEEKHIRLDDEGLKCVYIFRPSQHYLDYVDLLRNEKPITLWWSKKINYWQLATGKREPVGEGPG